MSSCAGSTSTSGAGVTARSLGSNAAVASSRRRRADSLRSWSVRRRDATVISHARGLSGRPSVGHCVAAASSASCTASSQASKCP